MNSTLAQSVRTPSRLTKLKATRSTVAPAVYIGTVAGFRELPAIDLYNLLAPVGEHPVGSTVSRRTLERFGYRLPIEPQRGPGGALMHRGSPMRMAS
jgi:hypothetical protein